MTVLLGPRPYQGVLGGTVVTFDAATETALVAQGLATVSAAALTTGAQTVNMTKGRVAIAIGAASVVVTSNMCFAESTVLAVLSGSTADGTLTTILRVTPANGSFTITGNANATAAVQVDFAILNNSGGAGLIR